MTVGELKAILANVDDSLEIVVRTETEDGDSFCGAPTCCAEEHGCDDEPFFAIDCLPEVEG